MDYIRPIIRDQQFLDAGGTAIDYGHRWAEGPADDAYGVTAHPERFAPLHVVAKALIVHLGAANVPVGTALRIDPPNPDAAPIEITLTDFPGVMVRAGSQFFAAFPACGCDACDDSVQVLVDDLEQTVLATVAGGLTETDGSYSLELSSGFLGHSHGAGNPQSRLAPAGRDWAPWHPASD